MTAAILLSVPQSAVALSCVPQGSAAEAESAAIAALRGDRGFGATSFVIAKIVGVDRSTEFPRVDIQATHVFAVGHPARFDAYVRPDGPPSLDELHEEVAYFLALRRTTMNARPVLLVAPCAPIFPITSAAQLERILDAADYSEAVGIFPRSDDAANQPSSSWPMLAIVALAAVALAAVKLRAKMREAWRRRQ